MLDVSVMSSLATMRRTAALLHLAARLLATCVTTGVLFDTTRLTVEAILNIMLLLLGQ